MSNETKNKTAADTVADNVQTTAEAVKDNATSDEATAPKVKAETKPNPKPKGKAKTESGGTSALKAVGVAACKRHGLEQVWVTVDGQVFPQESDAKAHAKNLQSNEILKVSAQ